MLHLDMIKGLSLERVNLDDMAARYKVVLIVRKPCIQPQSESPSARAIPKAQADVKGNWTSRTLEECVSTGGESGFVPFPIMLMALKS